MILICYISTNLTIYLITSSRFIEGSAGCNWTALHVAAWKGDMRMLNVMLPECSSELVNRGVEHLYTPLHVAAYKGHINVIKLLLNNGADVEVTTDDGWYPVHLAIMFGYLTAVKELIKELENFTEIRTPQGYSLLHVAARYNQIEIMDYLIVLYDFVVNSQEVDIETKFIDSRDNQPCQTPLHLAAAACNAEAVRALIQHGANVNAKTLLENTALHIACQKGYNEIVALLLDKNITTLTDFHGRNAAGWPPLHMAVFEGHEEIVTTFITYRPNVDLNQPISGGDRLLHIAIRQKMYGIIKILVCNEADPLLGGHNGLSALSLAQRAGDDDAIELLEANED